MNDALWTPSAERIENARLTAFARAHDKTIGDYPALHAWSIQEPEAFWSAVWDFCGVIGERGDLVQQGSDMPGAQFFPQAQLNFAENLLERGQDDDIAIRYRGEDGIKKQLTRGELKQAVAAMAARFKADGLVAGDRVAAMMPNRPETVIAMLATTSLGGVWTSCSPDFGQGGVLDRFGQVEPKIFLACADYRYGGKHFDTREKAAAVLAEIPSVVHAYLLDDEEEALPEGFNRWCLLEDNLPPALEYARLPFNHPLYILYSSGTTGVPKCIVHGAGGTLLQHMKEHQLQADIHAGDAVFYYTTCGWMMWNWLISALASEASLMLFDGSPFHPNPQVLFDYAESSQCSFFGISAKFIDALKSHDVRPREEHSLSSMRSLASTGSPLVAESFDYIYEFIKTDLAVQSISGGTDIVSCFVLGSPWLPVHRGEIQCKGLGMAVEVWNEQGQSSAISEKGDLVCTKPFPSMPIRFWNDEDGARYKSAYFENFPGIWHHGDYAEETAQGGLIIHGRSDATLNPGGVRIGTAEIYRQVEQIEAVSEALAVGQNWQDDVRIVLFLILKAGCTLDRELELKLKKRIREGASPRHVPAKIIQVRDFPRTRSGKLAELAVKDIIEGREVKNQNALANAEALKLFENLAELKS